MPMYKITKSDLETKVIPEIWCQFSNYNPRQNIDFQWSWSITCMYRNNDLPYQQKKHVCMYCIILYSKNGTAWVIQFWYVLIYYGAKKFLRSWLYQVAIFKMKPIFELNYSIWAKPYTISLPSVFWWRCMDNADRDRWWINDN